MATISECLAVAIQHHQAGRLQVAEHIYWQILQADPNHADAIHLLGLLAYQVGKHAIAVEYIGRAIRLNGNAPAFHNNMGVAYFALGKVPEAAACCRRALKLKPDYAEAHNNLGNALNEQGKLDEAVACYRLAVKLNPDYAEARNNLGVALRGQGKLDEAVICCRRAVRVKPDYAEAHNNLGVALRDQGKLDEAVACCRRAVELRPGFGGAYGNLGNALKDQGKLDEAVACYRRALEVQPDFAEAHNNLGNALKIQRKLDEAVACYRRALELKPDFVEAHNNLGNALNDQGKLDEAVACYRRALELMPDFAEAHSNLGNALNDQGKLDEAAACYRRALELMPDFAEAHWNRALLWLLTGDFAQGWPEYEWRWRRKQAPRRPFPAAPWDGRPLDGKTILLHTEQGLGDTIQFIRYAALLRQSGARVIVACQKALLQVLKSCPGIDLLVPETAPAPAFDAHVPLMSLPGIFQTSLESIPGKTPYLFADSELVGKWRERLREFSGFKIGICWQGNSAYRGDGYRSIALPEFAPLARIPGTCLISLQKGPGSEQVTEVRDRFPIVDFADELDGEAGPFMDTAAVMKNLDLVIAVDTVVAHLAGALGVPVWVALPLVPDWRWLLDRLDSPWYPTARLFRQRELGNWQGVFDDVREALCERIESSGTDGIK